MDSEPLLIVAGSIHYDQLLRLPRLPSPNDRLSALASTLAPGGMGGNVAAIAGRLGARVRFAGSFADDDDGRSLREDLVRDGVEVRHAGSHAGPSWRGLVLVGAGGDRAIISGSASSREVERAPGQWSGRVARRAPRRDAPGHAALLAAPLRSPGLFDGAVVGFACPGAFAALLLPRVPAAVPLFLDIETGHFDDLTDGAVRVILRRATVVYANEDNAGRLAERLTGGSVAALAALVGEVLVVTRGPAGCRVLRAGEAWDIPGVIVEVVDTTGAGDSFAAAFTVAWLRGMGPAWAGRFANLVAGLSVRSLGSRCGVPERAAIESIWGHALEGGVRERRVSGWPVYRADGLA